MTSAEAARSSGASGIAFDADIAATPRQTANADATSIFMGFFLSLKFAATRRIFDYARIVAVWQRIAALPVTAMPAPVPVVAMPMPATVPAVVPVMSPANLFGLEAVHFVLGGNGGTRFLTCSRRRLIAGNRLRRQRRGVDACRQRGGAGGNPNGEFQKIAAFHDISPVRAWQVTPTEFECAEMNGR
jgi:hypothetical protein